MKLLFKKKKFLSSKVKIILGLVILIFHYQGRALEFRYEGTNYKDTEKAERALFEKKKEKIKELLLEYKIDTDKVFVTYVGEKGCGSDEEGGFTFGVKSKSKIKVRDDLLPEKTSIAFCRGKIRYITPDAGSIKIGNFYCESAVIFKDDKVCECYLVKDYRLNGFTIKSPSRLIMDGEFLFIPMKEWRDGSVVYEYGKSYNIDSKGKILESHLGEGYEQCVSD